MKYDLSNLYGTQVHQIQNLSSLKRHQRSETAWILGSGPSVIKAFTDEDLLPAHDLIGTAHISLLKFPFRFLFYEPTWSSEGYSVDYGSIYLNLAEYVLHSHISTHIDDFNIGTIILNPQYPTSSRENLHPYLITLHRHSSVYLPSYFYINESTDFRIVQDLKNYINNHAGRLLNFRASIIRGLTLAYFLGYKNLNVAGLDPSATEYWYTRPESSLIFAPNVSPQIKHFCGVKGGLLSDPSPETRRCHEGELLSNTVFTFSYSFWFTIIILDKLFGPSRIPRITYFGSDPATLSAISSLNLCNRVRLAYSN